MTTLTKGQFFKLVMEKIKTDESFFNVVCQIMNDFELDGTDVGEMIKEDKTLLDYIKSEFGKTEDINGLF